ncbi:hypothetical protein ZWY2020_010664 [Hordeum vulgare]|nr:hypothetical protein ZWY2020_010664 [Hordeum vulgare]
MDDFARGIFGADGGCCWRPGHLPEPPLASTPMVEPVVGFMDEAVVELFGSFSPRTGSSSMPPVLLDFKGEASVEVVSPVLKIMPGLQVICGESISSHSMEQLMLGSLQASKVALVPLPPPEEPCRASARPPLDVVEREVLDVVAAPSPIVMRKMRSYPYFGTRALTGIETHFVVSQEWISLQVHLLKR